jgi:hypothetical protein
MGISLKGLPEAAVGELMLLAISCAQSDLHYRPWYGGLAIYREFGSPDAPGMVFFLGNGLLEVSGRSADPPVMAMAIWIQVRNVQLEHERLLAVGVPVIRTPQQEPWGLVEMWIAEPDGIRIVLVEVPEDHPLRRDQR